MVDIFYTYDEEKEAQGRRGIDHETGFKAVREQYAGDKKDVRRLAQAMGYPADFGVGAEVIED